MRQQLIQHSANGQQLDGRLFSQNRIAHFGTIRLPIWFSNVDAPIQVGTAMLESRPSLYTPLHLQSFKHQQCFAQVSLRFLNDRLTSFIRQVEPLLLCNVIQHRSHLYISMPFRAINPLVPPSAQQRVQGDIDFGLAQ